MVMVVVYAFGVEAGKTKAEQTAVERVPAVQVAAPVVPIVASSANVVRVQPITKAPPAVKAQVMPVYAVKAQPIAKAPVAAVVKAQPVVKVAPVAKPYTIVAVTFARRDNAIQEIYKIKKLGYDAVLVQTGNYFMVCVGAYSDKTSPDGQKDLKKLRRFYKDAYLKLR
jgi:hypothetical protein